jgi:hypothetical protein
LRRTRQHIALGQFRAERFGERRHRREILNAAMVNPVPELACTERRRAKLRHLRRQFFARQTDEALARIAGGRAVAARRLSA